MKMTENEFHGKLAAFTGDIERYRTLSPRVVYTPGVKYLAEHAGAYWLIDAIMSHLTDRKMNRLIRDDTRLARLQFWRLDVNPSDRSARLSVSADSGVPCALYQDIEYTDCPLGVVRIWAGFDGTRWTLMLPSEY